MKKIVLITTAVLGCVCMMACGGKAEKVDYDNEPGLQATQATEQTQDPEVTQEVEATQTPEQILSLAEDVVEEYNTGSKNYETTKEYLSSLQGAHEISELEDYMETVEVLKTSKENYAKAEVFAEAGETVRAIELYSKVDKQDVQYSEATTKKDQLLTEYKKDIFQAAKESANNKEYDEAIAVLDAAKGVLGKDAEWEAMMESYELQKEKQEIANQLKLAEEKADQGDYVAAITLLKPYKEKVDADLTKALAKYCSAYKKEMLADAKTYADKRDYESAVGKLNEAVAFLGEDEDLASKIEEYKAKYPVSLLDMPQSQGDDYEWIGNTVENIYGDVLEKGEGLSVPYVCLPGSSFEYLLNGQYNEFTAKVFATSHYDNAKVCLKVYADDVLVFDSGMLSKKSEAKNIMCKVSNVKFLRFEVTGSNSNFESVVLRIAKPMLYK